jgi:hypothetical protein
MRHIARISRTQPAPAQYQNILAFFDVLGGLLGFVNNLLMTLGNIRDFQKTGGGSVE